MRSGAAFERRAEDGTWREGGGLNPIRPHLVGLPIQRSVFGELHRAGELVGLASALPDGRFGAWLDHEGSLFLDRSHVDVLERAFRRELSPALLRRMDRSLAAACHAVTAATDRAAGRARRAGPAEARRLLAAVAGGASGIQPFPILTKFVPGFLLAALEAEGDVLPPPLPRPSPGARLSGALLDLYLRCLDLGFGPERLEGEWPAVPAGVSDEICAFCEHETGFGPVAWETPGYETPAHLFAAMRASFSGTDPDDLRARMARAAANPAAEEPAGGLVSDIRRVLRRWLEYMDLEIWYLRRAFYRGMVPMLRAVAWDGWGDSRPWEDLLFAGLDELAAGAPDPELLAERRRSYLEDADYLGRNGVAPGRLAEIMRVP